MSLLAPFKSLTRVSAFFTKELLETIRQPAMLLSVIVGPFIIMAIFGLGFHGVRRPLDTVLVVPRSLNLPRDTHYYQNLIGPDVNVVGVTDSATTPEERLRSQQIDLVVVLPADARERLLHGEHATMRIEYNVEDPIQSYYDYLTAQQVQRQVDTRLISTLFGRGETLTVGSTPIPPDVVAQPAVVDTTNVAPTPPAVVPFFGPAVFALIIQHLAVTLTALSLVRERRAGAFEVFRVSPVGALEMLAGKYLAFALLSAVVGAAVMAVMVELLHVPFLGSPGLVVGVAALLAFASLGVGLLISAVSSSERQAVQLSLMLLLASVFFSGFVLPIDEFTRPVHILAYALPVTHGIRLIQDLMLRGTSTAFWELYPLAAIGVVCFGATLLLVRRRLRPE